MKYTANFHFAGCLPEGDLAEIHLFDSPAEAWRDLLETMGDDRWAPDDEENDPDGPQSMVPAALEMEAFEDQNRVGTVWADGGCYEVDWVGDWEVRENLDLEAAVEEPKFDRAAALIERLKGSENKVRKVIEH